MDSITIELKYTYLGRVSQEISLAVFERKYKTAIRLTLVGVRIFLL